MSLGIFFCKRPNSICLLAGTKTIKGAERDRLFGLSGDGPKTEREEEGEGGRGRGGGGRDSGVTEITECPPIATATTTITLPAVGGGCSGDDERGRGSAPGPCCQGSPQDETERGSVTLGGPAGPTWTLLSPAARVFTTNQTP